MIVLKNVALDEKGRERKEFLDAQWIAVVQLIKP